MALVDQLKAIESALLSSTANARSLNKAFTDLQAAAPDLSKLTGEEAIAYNKTLETVKKVEKAYKDLGATGKENLEKLRKNMESVTDKTKRWAEELAKAGGLTGKLATGVLQVSHATAELGKSGDFGAFVQQITAGIPIVSAFGFAIGQTMSTMTKLTDQTQIIKKSFIDAMAVTGRFTEGLDLFAREVEGIAIHAANLRGGLADYEKLTGLSRDQTLGLIGALGKAGMTMEEMGIDPMSGKIKTFGESVADATGQVGGLAATVALARSSGLDFSQVLEQITFQSKQMGESVGDASNMFAQLQRSAERSKLSTQILLPIVRGMQEQYKFLTIDSQGAARAVGLVGEAARKAGFGPGVGAGLAGRAVTGFLGAGLGVQAFVGQQLKMGTGLSAAFAARQRPEQAALGIGDVVRQLTGGREVTRLQAAGNQTLAGIRAAQELMISQLIGLNQLEASAFLDMTNELKTLEDSGRGSTKEAQELKKKVTEAARGEGEYRARTLTAQEKMARLIEVMTSTLGKMFMVFVQSFLKGIGRGLGNEGGELVDTFNKVLTAAISGEGIDTVADMLESEMKKLEAAILPAGTAIAEWLGELQGAIIKVAIPAIKAVAEVLEDAFDFIVSMLPTLEGALQAVKDVVNLINPGGAGERERRESQARAAATAARERRKAERLEERSGVTARQAVKQMEQVAAVRKEGKAAPMSPEALAQAILEVQAQRALATAEGPTVDTSFWSNFTLRGLIYGLDPTFGPGSRLFDQLLPPSPAPLVGGVPGQAEEVKRLSAKLVELNELLSESPEAQAILSGKRSPIADKQQIPPGTASKDAWDIIRSGWLYAAQGDVVVDAESLGRALTTGERGAAIPDMFKKMDMAPPGIGQVLQQKEPVIVPEQDRDRRQPDQVEQEIVLHLVGVEDKLGELFDTYLSVNIEKGVVQVGKEGIGKLRHGSGYKGY